MHMQCAGAAGEGGRALHAWRRVRPRLLPLPAPRLTDVHEAAVELDALHGASLGLLLLVLLGHLGRLAAHLARAGEGAVHLTCARTGRQQAGRASDEGERTHLLLLACALLVACGRGPRWLLGGAGASVVHAGPALPCPALRPSQQHQEGPLTHG